MNNIKECDLVMECAIAGFNGCYNCKYMYKHKCMLKENYDKIDLDYEKALIDLDEEFPNEII